MARAFCREWYSGRKKGLFAGLLLFIYALSGWAQEGEFSLPPQAAWKRLYNRSEIIESQVSREIDADKSKWIDFYADVHTFTDIPMASLRATILDYESYPLTFNQYKSIVVSREGDRVFYDTVMGKEVLGTLHTMAFRQMVTKVVDEDGRLVLNFSHVSDDGRIKNARGTWYFESIPDTEWTYIRYYGASRVIQLFGLQRFFMSLLIDGESKDALAQFLRAARRRSEAG
jgi:hypothetical protein